MGFLGRILEIDLTGGKWSLYPFPEDLARRYLGGRGVNLWFLYRNLLPATDPLGPANMLLLSCGLLTGTRAPASSRLHINALSPLTGILGSSNVGGEFGAALRSCGIQTVILRGRASKPVFILIDADKVEICSAQSIWGLETWRTQDQIKKELGTDKLAILTIGPAGENKTLFACIMTGRDHAAGRTGMGAVMGSKNLKAIVAKKKRRAERPSTAGKHDVIKAYIQKIKNSSHFETLSVHGGAGYVKWADDRGILATRNYRENRFDAVDHLDGRHLTKYKARSRGCHGCPVHCKAELLFNRGGQAVRPEFEPMISLGPKCGLGDLETVVRLDNLCSRLGLDVVSAGSAIAFAMDLYDRGILSMEETGGQNLTWGNGGAMETLIQQLAYQEGLGRVLSQGIRKAAEIIGKDSGRFAPHVKGLELSGYHPFHIMGTALEYAVSSRGGDFSHFFPSIEYAWSPEKAAETFGTSQAVDLYSIHAKAPLVKRAMMVSIILDSLGLCKVPALSLIRSFDLEDEALLMNALAGWSMDTETLFRIGERIGNLEKLFNLRQGAGIEDDNLPQMFFEGGVSAGEERLQSFDWLTPMVQRFYEIMGWDEMGQPTEETINRLDLQQDLVPAADWKKAS
jgi:aldehyde:ferredoxin oxidoreductase